MTETSSTCEMTETSSTFYEDIKNLYENYETAKRQEDEGILFINSCLQGDSFLQNYYDFIKNAKINFKDWRSNNQNKNKITDFENLVKTGGDFEIFKGNLDIDLLFFDPQINTKRDTGTKPPLHQFFEFCVQKPGESIYSFVHTYGKIFKDYYKCSEDDKSEILDKIKTGINYLQTLKKSKGFRVSRNRQSP